ncbi:NrfD/PsrC family molybdoenzyme membrane anchor subunit [Streptosporangium sp. G11]|uniref:NrfD/PsrC family molybdoenzyme membrane anchor subunit n=1 Tax=Streptosporangium sp. G11 TaxID=3436926 RepID=UPI003EBC70A6
MRRGEEVMVPEAEFRSYYGQPIIKAPIWHEPHMPLYLYLGGTSGAASVISAVATLTGHDRLGLTARVTAAAGAAAGAGFLVAELGRPERFLNMLRVFKPTSPMSVGSWLLAAHSGLTALAAASALVTAGSGPRVSARSVLRLLVRFVSRVPARSVPQVPFWSILRVSARFVARVPVWPVPRIPGRAGLRIPALPGRIARVLPAVGDAAALAAVVTGPLMSTYTAVLVADTAVPAWHEGHPELPFLFAGSALAGAGAVGMLATPRREAGPARAVAVLGAAVETVAGAVMEHRLGLVGEPYRLGRSGRLMRTARVLTVGGALLATVAGRGRALTALSGLALSAGALRTRFGVLAAGRASAADPKYTVVPQRERLEAGG